MATGLPNSSAEASFHRLSISERNEDYDDGDRFEKDGLLGLRSLRARPSGRRISDSWFNILLGLNLGFSVFLVLGFVLLARNKSPSDGPVPPYSPLRRDGVIRYINSQYKPDKEFRSINPKVDEAWENWLLEHDRLFLIPKEDAIKTGLPESADAYNDPGYVAYGLAVYHQIHCLNRIRKTFDAEKHYPNEPQEKLDFHRDHCFDMIRQSILCHGDISLLYWWNHNYTYVDGDGIKHYTEDYLSRTPEQRATGTFATWDTAVQCRDLNSINTWIDAHAMDNGKYGGMGVG